MSQKCSHPTEKVRDTYQGKVGDELVTRVSIECGECGKFLRFKIIARRKLRKGEG